MYHHAANSAAQPNSSLNAPQRADSELPKSATSSCSMPSFWRSLDQTRMGCGLGELLPPRSEELTSVHWELFRLVSRPLLGITLRGLSGALRLGARSASASPPSGLRFPSTTDPPQMQSLALGSRAHSLALPGVTRAGYGKFNETEITTMYQNKVTLIGFLGNDAEVRSNDNRSLTTLSLATKSSYKKDGKYIEHTEWHRCVVFGKLAEFASTLKKGAHIQVEGELRSRKYDSKKTNSEQTIWEIRVNSILKLDRAAKATAEEQEDRRCSAEEAAA